MLRVRRQGLRHRRLGLRRQGVVGSFIRIEWDVACAMSAGARWRGVGVAETFRDLPLTEHSDSADDQWFLVQSVYLDFRLSWAPQFADPG